MLLRSDLPEGVVVRDLGDVQLKDVERERILTDAADGFPPLRTASRETEADQLAKQIESRVHELGYPARLAREERLREACRSRERTLAHGDVLPPTARAD